MDNSAELSFVPPASGDAFPAGPEQEAPYLHAYQPEAAAADPSILGPEADPLTNVIPFPAETARRQVEVAQAPSDQEAMREVTARAAEATRRLSNIRHITSRGGTVTDASQISGWAA